MYADYTYYTDEFKGNLLTAENFEQYEAKAARYIDYVTLNKAKKGYDNPFIKTSIQNCACALAEEYYKIDEYEKQLQLLKDKVNNGEAISSETIGKQSLSYQKIDIDKKSQYERSEENKKIISNVVNSHLLITGLLYRGIRCR